LTLLSFVPFVAGAVGMLGLMALLGLQFNFMNIFVGLMIIGVSTDYAIYMLQRYRENPGAFRGSAHETGKAILMAALTAIVGYGSFAFSHYPGLRSIGYASTFGIGLSGLAAITLLPPFLLSVRRLYCRLVLRARMGLDHASRHCWHAVRPCGDLSRRLVMAYGAHRREKLVARRRPPVHPGRHPQSSHRRFVAPANAASDRAHLNIRRRILPKQGHSCL
jgi:predicted exporter